MNEAYIELLERQARRGLGMLPDRAGNVERIQHDFERRQALAVAFSVTGFPNRSDRGIGS